VSLAEEAAAEEAAEEAVSEEAAEEDEADEPPQPVSRAAASAADAHRAKNLVHFIGKRPLFIVYSIVLSSCDF
jgi:hypothetical protein